MDRRGLFATGLAAIGAALFGKRSDVDDWHFRIRSRGEVQQVPPGGKIIGPIIQFRFNDSTCCLERLRRIAEVEYCE
jgi:hypothetical protein